MHLYIHVSFLKGRNNHSVFLSKITFELILVLLELLILLIFYLIRTGWLLPSCVFTKFVALFFKMLVQAALYQTDFRPVPLEEYIKVGNTIYDKKMDIIRTISKTADLGGKDPDHIVELCNEVGTLSFLFLMKLYMGTRVE